MESVNYLKLFEAGRLDPSVPEHSIKIQAYLAAYKIENPSAYEKIKAVYDAKGVEAVEEEEVVEEEVAPVPSDRREELEGMKKAQLKEIAEGHGIDHEKVLKADLISLILSQES